MSAEQIDAEKLERALNSVEVLSSGYFSFGQRLIVEAARAHLSTLPRVKEVEVESWGIVNAEGELVAAVHTEGAATAFALRGDQIVRLTGTAKVRVY